MTQTLPDRAHSASPTTATTARRPYPTYRDSGVPWLGQIPAHWEVKSLKRIVTLVTGGTPPKSEGGNYGDGTIPWIKPDDLAGTEPILSSREKLTEAGTRSVTVIPAESALVCCIGSVGKVGVAGADCATNQQINAAVFSHPDAWYSGYGVYALIASEKEHQRRANKVVVSILNKSGQGEIQFPTPPLDEQRAIAAYLDRETARLDALVAAKQRLIGLLREKRAALISRAVTRGLDAGAALRESGVPWLGQIPAHWEVKKTKYVARQATGHTPSRQHPEYWVDCTIPWISLADVWQLRDGQTEFIRDTSECISELGLANSSAVLLPAGTVILSRTASVGFSGIMSRPMATTQDFTNWVCGPTLRPEYLLYVFRSMEHEFRRLTMGSTHQTIYMPDIGRFVTPLPPLDEQDAIVRYIRESAQRIDRLSEKLTGQVEKLREYRSALIAAAVTGKIDVR